MVAEPVTAVAQDTEITPESPSTPAPEETVSPPAQDTPAAAAAEGTDAEAAATEPDHEAEWEALVGPSTEEKKPEAAAKDDLPGKSYDDIEAEAEAVLVRKTNNILQATDANWRQLLVDKLGFSNQDAHEAVQALMPYMRALRDGNYAHNMAVFREGVVRGLPQESAQAYLSRAYPNQADAIKAVYELGKRDAEKSWQSKVDGKQLFTRADLDKARANGENRARAAAERDGSASGTSSGTSARGRAGGAGRFTTKTAARTAHANGQISNAQMRQINADPSLPEM